MFSRIVEKERAECERMNISIYIFNKKTFIFNYISSLRDKLITFGYRYEIC